MAFLTIRYYFSIDEVTPAYVHILDDVNDRYIAVPFQPSKLVY